MKSIHTKIANVIRAGLTIGILAMVSASAYAQYGLVFFDGGVADSGTMTGPASFKATLYYGSSPGSLQAGPTTTGSYGNFDGGLVSLPPYSAYQMVYAQVRAWYPTSYATYEAAVASGNTSVRAGVGTTGYVQLGSYEGDAVDVGGFIWLYPLTGSLQVTITPAGAVSAGAQWRVDGGAWRSSGTVVSGLSVGSHTVSYSDVSGWTTPANQGVTITGGQTTTITGNYTLGTGSLQVTIAPTAAVSSGAQWRVDGGAWQNSGATVSGLSGGSHTASFSTISGWFSPYNQTPTINPGSTTTLTGVYQQITFLTNSQMTTARYDHTATLLPNGKVIVVGGYNNASNYLSSAELYDPSTGTWTATGAMNTPREFHTATLLPNGEVMAVGGYNGSNYLSSAALYDPATGTWTATGAMSTNRSFHTAVLLPNGKVLVAGGGYLSGSTWVYPSTTELYDPSTGTWTTTGVMATGRLKHTATLLPNGKVLVAGGYNGSINLSSAELYDPASGTWTATGSLTTTRSSHTATLLPSGKVLVVTADGAFSSAELYDPATGTWTATSAMTTGRYVPTATLLPNGKVLVAGGWVSYGMLSSAELYDPATGTWTAAGAMATPRWKHTATLLANGKVLVAGGDTSGNGTSSASTELYVSNVNSWINASDGKWETGSNWSMGTPSLTDPTDYVTNATTKTVTIDATTSGGYAGSMTINNLTLSAPNGSVNKLLLDNAGTMTPLEILSGFTVGSNGAVILNHSALAVDGNLAISSTAVNASLIISNGGMVVTPSFVVPANNSVVLQSGTLATGGTSVSNGLPFIVGDGTHPAALHVYGGVHSFANGLEIRNNASLTGCGTIHGDVLVDAGGTVLSDSGCSIVANQASVQKALAFDNPTGGLSFSGTVTNNGTLRVIGDSVLEISGTVVNNGTLDLINGSTDFHGTVINNGTVFDTTSVKISDAGMSIQDFVLRIPSVNGHTYQLQTSPSLTSPDWKDAGAGQAGTGGVLTFTDSGGVTNGPSRFYRIQVGAQ